MNVKKDSHHKLDLDAHAPEFLIAVGLVLMIAAYLVFTAVDIRSLQRLSDDTLSFVSRHLTYYFEENSAHQTDSLINLSDKAFGLRRMLNEEDTVTRQDLEEYLSNQHLTGLILLDEKLTPVYDVSTNGLTVQDWQNELAAADAAEIAVSTQKNYLACTNKNGAHYEYAIVPLIKEPGALVVYHKLHVEGPAVSLTELFADYTFKKNGVVVMIEDSMQDAAQDSIYTGSIVSSETDDDTTAFFACDFSERRFGLLRAEMNGHTWYGDTRCLNDYIVGVFFPYSEVFRQRTTILFSVLALYIIFMLLFFLIRRQMEDNNLRAINQQYRIIDAISSIFTSILMVDITTDTLEVVSIPDFLAGNKGKKLPARKALESWTQEYTAEADKEKHLKFVDFTTVQERLAGHSHIQLNYKLKKEGAWCQVIMIPKRWSKDGKIESVLLVTRDISKDIQHDLEVNRQLQETADDARRANAAKTDFLRRMSHDIRTPINGIRGMVEIGDHFPEDMEKQSECRRKILQASDFLLDLVNNVLDMNKLESGELILEDVPFDLRRVSHEVATIIRPQAAERNVTLTTSQLSATHLNLIGSPLYTRQILLNLAGNAIKYNRPGGTLAVSCTEIPVDGERSNFRFTIADTGLGMSEEFQKHLFEPFSQENVSGRSSYTGTGLGLSITKELIEKMGGTISFTSKQGVGTTFVVTLPFKIDQSAAATPETVSTETHDLHGTRALLAEDNDLNREIADFILENEGIEVTNAIDGKQAVDLFADSAPGYFDVVLMDVMMPVMDGLEAAKRIRAMERSDAGTVPIFAMTANAFSDDVRLSQEAGMNEHLSKPLDSKLLIEKLQQYLRR